MRSAAEADDLTTKARIRDAAIRRFGADGYERTSIRAIAADAGVSPALVIHHFGSKDELRRACTDVLLEQFLSRKNTDLTGPGAAATMRSWLDDVEQFRPLIDYLSRLLVEDSPAADELFDGLLDGTRRMIEQQTAAGLMRRSADPEVTAVVVTLYGLAPLLAKRQLARALGGADVLDTATVRRLTVPILELFTFGLYTDDRYLRMAGDALGRPVGPPHGKGDNDPVQDPDPPAAPASAS